jgi:hypothetical protein
MDDVVVLAISSSRSDPIQRCKWRRLREMHTYSAPTTPPSWSSEIWWSGRWDRQHDGVVSMVKSMRRQGFAGLRGRRRTEKGGFRNRAAAPRELGRTSNGGASVLFIGGWTIDRTKVYPFLRARHACHHRSMMERAPCPPEVVNVAWFQPAKGPIGLLGPWPALC